MSTDGAFDGQTGGKTDGIAAQEFKRRSIKHAAEEPLVNESSLLSWLIRSERLHVFSVWWCSTSAREMHDAWKSLNFLGQTLDMFGIIFLQSKWTYLHSRWMFALNIHLTDDICQNADAKHTAWNSVSHNAVCSTWPSFSSMTNETEASFYT